MQPSATTPATVAITDTTANPAPLGLMGFGMTTVLLNLHNAFPQTFALDSMVLAMGICYGGIAQVIAGIQEWKKDNTFGATAFTSYGFFWLSLVVLLLLPKLGLATATDPRTGLAAYLAIWGLFTGFMFFATLKSNKALQVVFATLTVLFFLLALGDALANPALKRLAGLEGLICGLAAIYLAMGQVLNAALGRTVLPLGAPPRA
ncbi:MAG: acetate uptake transporter [Lentisphaeria bacterium]